MPSSEARVITPRPPIWIRTAITASPNPDQKTGVSVTISPVTHVADVAVNNASTNEARSPSVAIGRESNPVPAAIVARNPSATICPGRRRSAAALLVSCPPGTLLYRTRSQSIPGRSAFHA